MAIPTTRTKTNGEIRILTEKCTGCGLCVSVCKDFSLVLSNGKVTINENPVFGCIGCGHCMAICPEDAIEVYGRTLSPEDLFLLPDREKAADYESLLTLYQRRRSIREFRDKAVEPEIIEKILDAARTAPMGLPPSDVNVMILDSVEKNRAFVSDFIRHLEGMKWFVSGWFLALMRPVWGKESDELFKAFGRPLFDIYINGMKKGQNNVTYDAPLVMYFYGSPYSDPADPIVAATAAMYAGESLGLGTCMLGAMHPLIQNGKKARKFRERHGIRHKSREGLFVIFGYPKVKYRKGIRRSFAGVN
ncbi:MAG: nitroreductase family protein [Bacteroidetes bacterium]|nr:nitroreductase family protein [Bacteroidota bacterium]